MELHVRMKMQVRIRSKNKYTQIYLYFFILVIGKKLAVRAKVAKELVATEVTYCNAISSIVSVITKFHIK